MKFQDGYTRSVVEGTTSYIDKVPYWGAFENRDVAQNVISDLQVALGDTTVTKQHEQTGDYVIAFLLNSKLYISRRNYHALVVNRDGARHVKKKLASIHMSSPRNGVLVLSKVYMDDLPKFDTAEQFCKVMSQLPAQQFCIPLKSIN